MEWDALLSKKHPGTDFGEAGLTNYDAIIRSTLFRRLQDKAQVFPLDNDDYVRTRLTHSLEVSAIGKELGRRVFSALQARHVDPWFDTHGADEFSDVLLCAGLIHDIGNPPFGHFGEYAIREWFQTHLSDLFVGEKRVTDLLTSWQLQDLYSFEGNAQSLRLLSKTPYLGENRGFHLSCSVLGAIMKYPISAEDLAAGNNPKNYRKIGYSLLDQFVPAAILYDSGEPISFTQRRTMDTISAFYKSMYQQESQGKSDGEKLYLRLLLITDYISGMTDSYAKRLYQELFV